MCGPLWVERNAFCSRGFGFELGEFDISLSIRIVEVISRHGVLPL